MTENEIPSGPATNPSDDIHKSTARILLDYGKLEYADVCATWRDIEGKAQGTVAIAGIFIAGIVALLGRLQDRPCTVSVVLALVILLLVAAVGLAVAALFVSEIPVLKDSGEVREEAQAILTAPDDAEAKRAIRAFVLNLASEFSKTSGGLHTLNLRKAGLVRKAQLCLAIGVVVMALLLVVSVFSNWGPGAAD